VPLLTHITSRACADGGAQEEPAAAVAAANSHVVPALTHVKFDTLGADEMEGIMRYLSTRDVARLPCVCKALKAVATPRLDDWAWLRKQIETNGDWNRARRLAKQSGRTQVVRWVGELRPVYHYFVEAKRDSDFTPAWRCGVCDQKEKSSYACYMCKVFTCGQGCLNLHQRSGEGIPIKESHRYFHYFQHLADQGSG